MSTQNSQKKNAADSCLKDCAYCGAIGAKLTCAKCKATHYCSKACQKQHWKNGHKTQCVSPEERRPHVMPSGADKCELNSGECPICLESFSDRALCILPCKHEFHGDCVEEIRKQGVQQACPICRSALPPGPVQLFEDAIRMYVRMAARHRARGVLWNPQTAAEKENMTQVLDMLNITAKQGHIRAQFTLGEIYSGSGVARNREKSMQWFRKAADQGDAPAQLNVAIMYDKGEGVAQDDKKAAHWYRKAADEGLAKAQYNLGSMYNEGKGLAQDFYEAARWYRKAADQGHVDAQCNLGTMYSNGEGISEDYKEAMRWYRKAADQGDAEAQCRLGRMYHEGKGFAQDFCEAARWFRKAADQGYAIAQFDLGIMHFNGEGVAQDYNEMARWYRKAADQGLADAQFRLGAMYYWGKGLPKDLKLAHFFLSASKAQGDDYAHGLLEDVETALNHTFNDSSNLNADPPSQCTCCGRRAGNAVKLKPCPRCKGPLYCGKDCQRTHWKEGHKECCFPK